MKTLGGGLLIAGSCIGIGMLALPMITGLLGFTPTLILFLLCALFMGSTALLLVEVDLSLQKNVNIITLAQDTLGSWARILAWITYLFLFASLMVAYVAKGGDILGTIIHVPASAGSIILAITTGAVIFWGKSAVDIINRLFMVGFFVAYILLLAFGIPKINTANLFHVDTSYALMILPIAITAFGFHNMIPSISDYLDRRKGRIISAVFIGVLVPLVVYLLWCLLIQGIAPASTIAPAYRQGLISTQLLYTIVQSPAIQLGALYMSFFAIITSVLGQGLGFVDFLLDGLRLSRSHRNKLFLILLIFLPAYILARIYPALFFTALSLAGGIAAVLLFGLLPIAMVWSGRYHHQTITQRLIPGGRVVLLLLAAFGVLIFGFELFQRISGG